jgi:hypothetical protein
MLRRPGCHTVTRIGTSALSCLLVIFLAGCEKGLAGQPSPVVDAVPESGPTSPPTADLQSIIAAATRSAALQLGIAPETIEVVRAERVTWSDGSVGCPAPGMQYTQALVPGYRVILRAEGQELDYHAAANGHFALCPPGRAIDPAVDNPT